MIPAVFFEQLPDLLAAHPEVAAECVCVVEVHAGPVARTIVLLEAPGEVMEDRWPSGADFFVDLDGPTWDAAWSAPATIPDLVESGEIGVADAPFGAQVLGRLIVLAKGGA